MKNCANAVIARTLFAVLLLAPVGAAQAQADLRSGSIFSRGYRFEQKDGEALYQGICQGCHMPDAKGASGAGRYPALAANARLAAKQYPLMLVVKGSRAMPGFGDQLSPEQIAAVVNYLRTHFGNAYTDTVTPAEVRALLPAAKENKQ